MKWRAIESILFANERSTELKAKKDLYPPSEYPFLYPPLSDERKMEIPIGNPEGITLSIVPGSESPCIIGRPTSPIWPFGTVPRIKDLRKQCP